MWLVLALGATLAGCSSSSHDIAINTSQMTTLTGLSCSITNQSGTVVAAGTLPTGPTLRVTVPSESFYSIAVTGPDYTWPCPDPDDGGCGSEVSPDAKAGPWSSDEMSQHGWLISCTGNINNVVDEDACSLGGP